MFDLETIEEIIYGDNNVGFCIKCGCEMHGVEPDACKYECPDCKESAVYGAEMLVVMGYVS